MIRGLAQHRLGQADLRRQPPGFELPGRKLLLQERQVHKRAVRPWYLTSRTPRIGVAAHDGGLHRVLPGQALEAGLVLRRHGHHHALLGFGHPDFPGVQALVFQGHRRKLDLPAAGHPG